MAKSASARSSRAETLIEVNFDGIVGPTHNYAGLSFGNVASSTHAGRVSRPREAALQGLTKARVLMEMGLFQGFLPPQVRPDLALPRQLGYSGTDAAIIKSLAADNPILLAQVYSSSHMWAANAATVSPSVDTADRRVHFTPANLKSMLHRSIEPSHTAAALRGIFAGAAHFVVHDPLPSSDAMGDEGAANHTRLFDEARNGPGVHLFVYGVHHSDKASPRPTKFPARQTREACEAVARRHGLDLARCVYAQQHPRAIDGGAFHNDVVCVGNGATLFYHADAFLDEAAVLKSLRKLIGPAFTPVRVERRDVPLAAAVKTYLFNSQLVTLSAGGPRASMHLVAPSETQTHAGVKRTISHLFGGPRGSSGALGTHTIIDVRESMRNGGGPACLRLRVPLTAGELAAVNPACLATPRQIDRLAACIIKHYPETLTPKDLADPTLIDRARRAVTEVRKVLDLA